MSETITIRKGLDLPISGVAEKRLTDARSITTYAMKPTDFVGLTPRLLVEEGDMVDVGDALFCDKSDERIRFTSPVNGQVKAIVRGEKRKLLEVVVEADFKSAGSTVADNKSATAALTTADAIKAATTRPRPFSSAPSAAHLWHPIMISPCGVGKRHSKMALRRWQN